MFNPIATYRIQFHKDFTFADFENVIPYLHKLGVTTIYASPIFEAVPGSMHGYDVVNPHRINPEIGTEAQLRSISDKLKKLNMHWLQDIVPNHMAYHPDNVWLMDVLEKGRYSLYAHFFDLGWTSELFHGRLLAPFLGSTLEEVLANSELQVQYKDQRLVLQYFDQSYPMHPRSYEFVLESSEAPEAVRSLVQQISDLHQIDNAVAYALSWHELVLQLDSLMKQPTTGNYIMERVAFVNDSPEMLQEVVDEQKYRLTAWQRTDERISFRRFFTVNGLIGLNMHDDKVFEHYHQYIASLVSDGIFQGLRIDHVDGLYDPGRYLQQLRKLVGNDVFIAVEKILQEGESLPAWPVAGTTGYEFLATVNNVLTDSSGEEQLTTFYKTLSDHDDIDTEIRKKKAHILNRHMAGELENLYKYFLDLNLVETELLAKVNADDLRSVIGEFLVRCPVYRYYGNSFPLPAREQQQISSILAEIRNANAAWSDAVGLLEHVWLTRPLQADEETNARIVKFYMRCMQFTGPIMAKGVEDTVMYTYNRFVAHNEVGDSPVFFGLSKDEFHHQMKERQHAWPMAMNATATHDTKRGEDVRARLQVLGEQSKAWQQLVQRAPSLDTTGGPDANDVYLIYQTLIGVLPFDGEDETLDERLSQYLTKSLREAKRHSDWAEPNEEYENKAITFAKAVLSSDNNFRRDFIKFQRMVADAGIVHTLAQVLLKFTCPGIPDVYQGCEWWDFSLVDPDNRRPVDFNLRQAQLKSLDEMTPAALWDTRTDGRIKQWLTHTLLLERQSAAKIFLHGDYIPLATEGNHKDHVLAFARKWKKTWYVTVVPLYTSSIEGKNGNVNWKDTRVILPGEAPAAWTNLLDKKKGNQSGTLALKDLLMDLPVAWLKLEHPSGGRGAGILMHVTSLPAAFGIGDLGPAAYEFADFLYRSHQTIWQVLPLNPTDPVNGYSPYSSYSSNAGNVTLISPELLVHDGLLEAEDIEPYRLPPAETVDFANAIAIRKTLLDKAWLTFSRNETHVDHADFIIFKERHEWLSEFVLYNALREHHKNEWTQWPDLYRKRDIKALQEFADGHQALLEKQRWFQFIFNKQWLRLRRYCNTLGISILGDVPFYMCHDSVDVWMHNEIFSLDEHGLIKGMAGVPPDYFNKEGQRWGMPVFNWDALKEDSYSWWIKRIARNLELYDSVRLDHFRAFASYWEIEAGESTAVNGVWKEGPRAQLFDTLKHTFKELPVVAEDLGEITEDVFSLRDAFNLPGMKVLQFAVGENMHQSMYAPHNFDHANYVAYTGTHDNNTTVGWFRNDLSKNDRTVLAGYTGYSVNERNAHKALMQLAYSSVARDVIVPLQDVLGLDASARMNTPGTIANNWQWRLLPGKLSSETENYLRLLTIQYNRI